MTTNRPPIKKLPNLTQKTLKNTLLFLHSRLPREMAINAEDNLMRAVTKACMLQLASNSAANRRRQDPSPMEEVVNRAQDASKKPGGIQQLASAHLPAIITAVAEKVMGVWLVVRAHPTFVFPGVSCILCR